MVDGMSGSLTARIFKPGLGNKTINVSPTYLSYGVPTTQRDGWWAANRDHGEQRVLSARNTAGHVQADSGQRLRTWTTCQ